LIDAAKLGYGKTRNVQCCWRKGDSSKEKYLMDGKFIE